MLKFLRVCTRFVFFKKNKSQTGFDLHFKRNPKKPGQRRVHLLALICYRDLLQPVRLDQIRSSKTRAPKGTKIRPCNLLKGSNFQKFAQGL